MLEEKSFQKSIYLKIIHFFVLIGWYLSWATIILLMVIILASSFFDFQMKIIQIPVEVQFENIELNPLNSGLSGLDIVSFSNPRVIIDNTDFFNSSYYIPLILIIVIIARVLEYGVSLKNEQKLTI